MAGQRCSCPGSVSSYPQLPYRPEMTSRCVMAGSTSMLIVEPRDAFGRLSAENTLTSSDLFNISVLGHPLRFDGRNCLPFIAVTSWSEQLASDPAWAYQTQFDCNVAGSYEISIMLFGEHIHGSPQLITIVPQQAQPQNTLAYLVGSSRWCVNSTAAVVYCRTLPRKAELLLVRIRDQFGNERRKPDVNSDDTVRWSDEIALTHTPIRHAQTAVWDNSVTAYRIDFEFDSDEYRSFFVNLTVNGQSWKDIHDTSDLAYLHVLPLPSTVRFDFAASTSINTLACGKISRCSLYHPREDVPAACADAGCLFVAGQPNEFQVHLDWQLGTIVTVSVSRACDERSADGIQSNYYWQQSMYCFANDLGYNSSGQAADAITVTQPLGWRGKHFDGNATVQVARPGIFTVVVTLEATNVPTINYTTRVSIGPGLTSPRTSTVLPPRSKIPTLPSGNPSLSLSKESPLLDSMLGGEIVEFHVQATDVNDNVGLATDEVFVEISRVSISNPVLGESAEYQPSSPYVLTAMTEGLCSRLACTVSNSSTPGTKIEYGSPASGVYTFELPILQYGVFSVSVWICQRANMDGCLPTSPTRHEQKITGDQIFTICPQNSNITEADLQHSSTASNLHNCFCKRGFVGIGRGRTCLACPAGKFAPDVGLRECTSCAVGTSCGCDYGAASVDIQNCTDLSWQPACDHCPSCTPGKYQNLPAQSACRICQDGFACVRSKMTYPLALPGYWISPRDPRKAYPCEPDLACPGSSTASFDDVQLSRATGAAARCFSLQPPMNGFSVGDICREVVGSVCEVGYTGEKCANCCRKSHIGDKSCDGDRWYRTNKLCKPCKHQSSLWVTVIAIVFVIVLGPVLFKLSQIARHLGPLQVRSSALYKTTCTVRC